MRKTLCTLTAVALTATTLAAPQAMAAQASAKETIGIGTGGVIGAVAGGPLGFVIGAAIGAKIGDTLHKKDEQIDELSASLESRVSMVAARWSIFSSFLCRVSPIFVPMAAPITKPTGPPATAPMTPPVPSPIVSFFEAWAAMAWGAANVVAAKSRNHVMR